MQNKRFWSVSLPASFLLLASSFLISPKVSWAQVSAGEIGMVKPSNI